MKVNYIEEGKNNKRLLTVERLKQNPKYSHLTDSDAEDIILQLDILSEIIVKQLISQHNESI